MKASYASMIFKNVQQGLAKIPLINDLKNSSKLKHIKKKIIIDNLKIL